MQPQLNLLILHTLGEQALSDWTGVKDRIVRRAPEIETRIVDSSLSDKTRTWQRSRPSLVFSASGKGSYEPDGGTIHISSQIPEEHQYKRLTAAGVAAPKTIELKLGMVLRPDVWGEYVISKPIGDRDANDLRLVRTEDVAPRYAAITNTVSTRVLIKRYIHSVDRRGFPFEYRVLTMMGTVLYAARIRGTERRPPLAEFAKDYRGIPSSDTVRVRRRRTLAVDEDVLQLARSAAVVFPESACLGIDILRESTTGELFVIEVNSGGQIWNFSSQRSEVYDPSFRRSLYTQFNALDRAADLLIEKTRASAS